MKNIYQKDKVYVEGKIKRKWQGDDGSDKYTEVNVDEFTFLSTKKDSGNNMEQNLPPVSDSQGLIKPKMTYHSRSVNIKFQNV